MTDQPHTCSYYCELEQEVKDLRAALKRQAAAAIAGMDAAHRISGTELREAQKLKAECSPESVASQREANERLTNEVEALKHDIERMNLMAPTWLPIATAPTDGTKIIVYAPEARGYPEMVAFCSYHPDAGFVVDEFRTPTRWTTVPEES